MACNEGSSSLKELFCYFHVGGKFVCNDECRIQYNGGSVKLKCIKEGTTLSSMKSMVSSWLGVDCNMCDMKYSVMFDERTLIDLNDDGEVGNLIHYNERSGHVYIAPKDNDNVSDTLHETLMVENIMGLSQQTCTICPSIVENNYEPPTYESAAGSQTDEIGSGCNMLVCGVESAPTPTPELNCTKWRGLFSGHMQCFPHAEAFKQSLYKYSIAHNFEFTYVRNNKHSISVKCKVVGCPWKITANAIGKATPLLRVTTFRDEHYHCAQDNLQVTHGGRSNLTSSIIVDEVRNHIDKRPNEIRKMLLTEYGVTLTYKQAYRAKEKAMEDVEGRPEHSYMLIPWLCQRLKESDDKTVAEWEATPNNIFERVFIAYGCCTDGFIAGARHVLYVDGTFLSGPYKGTLLSASGYDADNELLPFAIAIVKGETLEDWSWFLQKIKDIVGSIQLTIVSDRHQAIKGAVHLVFGGERHAFCYRHVKENFSSELLKVNRGKRKTSGCTKDDALRLLDNVAYARLEKDFDKAMEFLRQSNEELHDWLINHGDVSRLALSKFPFRRWDKITTNIAESFNAWMVNERKHNVTQLIHEHREKVAKKMYAASIAMTKWKNGVGPNIESLVKENVSKAEQMAIVNYGGGRICVHTRYGALNVDLGLRLCSCEAWQMSGIPCAHACAAIKHVYGNVYEYVEECYTITSQEKIYRRSMVPIVTIDKPDPNNYMLENISGQPFLLPPRTSRPPGRPRTNRHESQFQSKKIYHCGRCNEAGHTKKTCKNPNPT